MAILSSYHSTCITPTIISPWTFTDHKRFEQILATIPYISQNSDPWISIAAQLGKTPMEVKQHYDMLLNDVVLIESGRVPLPSYADDHHHHDHIHDDDDEKWTSMDNDGKGKGKQIRKKGEQWTTDEHKLFLLGLKKCGKGDWKSISGNFVTSKSPTQVASHAQKFFLRQTQNTNQNNRKRTSIHDTIEVDDDSLTDLICRGVVPLEVLAQTPNANLHHPSLKTYQISHDLC